MINVPGDRTIGTGGLPNHIAQGIINVGIGIAHAIHIFALCRGQARIVDGHSRLAIRIRYARDTVGGVQFRDGLESV